MEAQRVVDSFHEFERQYAERVPDSLDGDGADVFCLGFGVRRQSGIVGLKQHLERQDSFGVRGQWHDNHGAVSRDRCTGIGSVIADENGGTLGRGLSADRRSEVDYSDFAAPHVSSPSPSPATLSQSAASSSDHSSKAAT